MGVCDCKCPNVANLQAGRDTQWSYVTLQILEYILGSACYSPWLHLLGLSAECEVSFT